MRKKLVEILAEKLLKWPEHWVCVVQDEDGERKPSRYAYIDIGMDGVWQRGGHAVSGAFYAEKARDRKIAKVTYSDWSKARAQLLLEENQIGAPESEIIEPVRIFTEADIRAAFAAGANWVRGGIEEGAVVCQQTEGGCMNPECIPSGESAAVFLPHGTEARVCAMVAQRQALGLAKYGTTVENNPLTHREWLQHALEEALDMAIYLQRAIEEMDK